MCECIQIFQELKPQTPFSQFCFLKYTPSFIKKISALFVNLETEQYMQRNSCSGILCLPVLVNSVSGMLCTVVYYNCDHYYMYKFYTQLTKHQQKIPIYVHRPTNQNKVQLSTYNCWSYSIYCKVDKNIHKFNGNFFFIVTFFFSFHVFMDTYSLGIVRISSCNEMKCWYRIQRNTYVVT